ncbi:MULTISPECIES: alpha/beta fold hydrolase [unclassified Sphingobium]|uniref:alpha/beta fold hydrolase n=1 Tax=unclassified Sphingobium TaxID=2611147 RepID=UPI002224D349|nr:MULTISPECIES: alpha/beta hydrolase [unclassified Sphingobium]MCW2381890.1 pimeloyl-ACP methyl ester carboxylesterase [Sphingobium sp. B2D3B]MCW2398004.1 pimeloyl-ACP methyl ester carboxylesterase [Sphingobium sp. B2D3C]
MTETSTIRLEHLQGHDGTRIAVHRLGDGPAVIMLHGLSSSAQINWQRYGTAQKIADAGFEAIMIDQRVHGCSDAPTDADAYPQDVMLLDMEAVIGALGVTQFDLVGYSMGARLCLGLIDRGMTPRQLVLGGMGLEGLLEWARRRQFFLNALDHFETVRPGDRDYMAIHFMKTMKIDPVALRLLLMSMSDMDHAVLAKVTMPTLVLCGEDDDDNGSADALVGALPDAQRGTCPGTHMTAITKPEFGQAIADYLAG